MLKWFSIRLVAEKSKNETISLDLCFSFEALIFKAIMPIFCEQKYWILDGVCYSGTVEEEESVKMVEKTKGRKEEVVTREFTINLHKRLHGW